MKIVKPIALSVILISMWACSDYNAGVADKSAVAEIAAFNEESNNAEAKMAAVTEVSQAPTKTVDELTERKLIKNGEISFETNSLVKTKAFLQKLIVTYNGYISNETIESYRTNPTEVLTVRIPGTNFDSLISKIGQQAGEFDSKRISIDDVTAEFVDVEARLKNKRQLEEKYRELLKKADNMETILQIEAEISGIREDIESTEGRLRYLNSQVNYSTLTITYYEEKPATGFKFGEKIGDAVSNGGTGFLWFMISLVELWPLWIAGLIFFFIIRKLIRRYKKRKALQEKPNP